MRKWLTIAYENQQLKLHGGKLIALPS